MSQKSMAADPRYCHICGFPIPPEIVSQNHPLYGTIDHLIPKSRGGRNVLVNRLPAHWFCNRVKGAKMMPLSRETLCDIQGNIRTFLKKNGMSDKQVRAAMVSARQRIKFDKLYPYRPEWEGRWEDDGGAIY